VEELKTNETYAWAITGFTDEEIERIKNLNIEKKQASVDSDNIDHKIRNSKVRWINNDEENRWIYEKILPLIQYINGQYFRFDLNNIEPLQLTEYDQNYGGFYTKHVDHGYDKNMNRKLSFVIFLSDPSEYEGGELLLYNSTEPIKPEEKKGNVVFFPSYVLHEVTPVKSGIRNTLVGWINGPRFK
jgi:predicted 2-oxoglutarate/Fe(II)-dependent dioxygenase YbiX